MKNRECISNTNVYDFLCKMNTVLGREDPSCVLDLLKAKEKDRNGLWCESFSTCDECIQKWLNMEAR